MAQAKKFTIVVLGRDWSVGSALAPDQCRLIDFDNTEIISTPDASKFNEEHIYHLMALSHPGPNVYLLEESGNPKEELRKWQRILGWDIYPNIIYNVKEQSCLDKSLYKCINEESPQLRIRSCRHIYEEKICAAHSFSELLKEGMASLSQHQASPRPGPGVQQLRLVLLGECGSGKSCSGNTILGGKRFRSMPSSMPTTTECMMISKSVYGTEVQVIDTPDLFNDELQLQSKHVMDCRELCKGGLCVYLLVIQIGRFTEGQRDILKRLESALETSISDRAIILFTHGDDLNNQPIDDYVRNTNQHLQQLISQCGNRYQVFNNRDKKGAQQQMMELMWKIAPLVNKTDAVGVFPEYDIENKTESEGLLKGLKDSLNYLWPPDLQSRIPNLLGWNNSSANCNI